MDDEHEHILEIKQAAGEGKGFRFVKKTNDLLCTLQIPCHDMCDEIFADNDIICPTKVLGNIRSKFC